MLASKLTVITQHMYSTQEKSNHLTLFTVFYAKIQNSVVKLNFLVRRQRVVDNL